MSFVPAVIPGCLIALFAFYLRAKPRFGQKFYGVDAWYYLLYAEEFRRTKRLPIRLPYFLLDIEEQWYPPLFPMLLSLFPQKFLENYQWAISPFIDCIQLLVLYFFTYAVTHNVVLAMIAGIIYSVTPTLINESLNLNSRSFSSLLLTLTLLAAFGYILSNSLIYLVLAIVAIVALLFAHKMAVQELAFALLFLGLFRDLRLIIMLLGGILLAIVVSKGFYFKILRGHIDILFFWRRNLHNLGAHQIHESPVYGNSENVRASKFFQLGAEGFIENLKRIITSNYFLVLVCLLLLFVPISRQPMEIFVWWIGLTYLLAFLTLVVPPFRFLGEGNKYIKYAAFPVAYLSARMIFYMENLWPIFFGLSLVLLVRSVTTISWIYRGMKSNFESISDELFNIFEVLKARQGEGVACIPLWSADALAYFSRKKVLWGAHSAGYDKLEPFFPVIKKPLQEFISEYKVAFVLVNKKYVNPEDLKLDKFPVVVNGIDYVLYQVGKR